MRIPKNIQEATSPDDFAHRLRTLRLQKNLLQKELAQLAGVTPVHYGRYERGISRPTADALKRLADALEVSGDFLLDGGPQVAARSQFSDRELLRLFQEVQSFSDREKETVKSVIEAFVVRRKLQDLAVELNGIPGRRLQPLTRWLPRRIVFKHWIDLGVDRPPERRSEPPPARSLFLPW